MSFVPLSLSSVLYVFRSTLLAPQQELRAKQRTQALCKPKVVVVVAADSSNSACCCLLCSITGAQAMRQDADFQVDVLGLLKPIYVTQAFTAHSVQLARILVCTACMHSGITVCAAYTTHNAHAH